MSIKKLKGVVPSLQDKMPVAHNFTQTRSFSDSEWNRLSLDVATLLSRLPDAHQGVPLRLCGRPGCDDVSPIITPEEIRFANADPEEIRFANANKVSVGGTFSLQKYLPANHPLRDENTGAVLRGCRSLGQSFDIAVCAALLVADVDAHGVLDIEPAGRLSDWTPAIDLVAEILPERLLAFEPFMPRRSQVMAEIDERIALFRAEKRLHDLVPEASGPKGGPSDLASL